MLGKQRTSQLPERTLVRQKKIERAIQVITGPWQGPSSAPTEGECVLRTQEAQDTWKSTQQSPQEPVRLPPRPSTLKQLSDASLGLREHQGYSQKGASLVPWATGH